MVQRICLFSLLVEMRARFLLPAVFLLLDFIYTRMPAFVNTCSKTGTSRFYGPGFYGLVERSEISCCPQWI